MDNGGRHKDFQVGEIVLVRDGHMPAVERGLQPIARVISAGVQSAG